MGIGPAAAPAACHKINTSDDNFSNSSPALVRLLPPDDDDDNSIQLQLENDDDDYDLRLHLNDNFRVVDDDDLDDYLSPLFRQQQHNSPETESCGGDHLDASAVGPALSRAPDDEALDLVQAVRVELVADEVGGGDAGGGLVDSSRVRSAARRREQDLGGQLAALDAYFDDILEEEEEVVGGAEGGGDQQPRRRPAARPPAARGDSQRNFKFM